MRTCRPYIGAAALLLASLNTFGDELAADDRRLFADSLMSRGMYSLALEEYKAITASGGNAAGMDVALSRLAECQRQTGDAKGAIATCERLGREWPQSPARHNASLTHALALESLGDAKGASRIFDVISSEPAADQGLRLHAMYFAGESYFKAGELETAETRFNLFLKMSADGGLPATIKDLRDFAALYIAEITFKVKGQAATDAVLAEYARIAAGARTPRIAAEALYKGAVLAYLAKRNDDAAARFAALLDKHPSDKRAADALLPAAWANFGAGRFADAAAIADRILASPAKDAASVPEALYVKGAALAKLSRNSEAAEVFAKLIASYPSSKYAPNAKYGRLVLLFKDNRHADLLKEAAAFANPPAELAADILWLQAEASEAIGDSARATQFYTMLAERSPDSPLAAESLFRSARHRREAGAWLEASGIFHKLLLAHPDSELAPFALYESACCLAKVPRRDEAIRDFDALLEKHPAHKLVPDAMLQKAMALNDDGRVKDAAAVLDSLLAKFQSAGVRDEAAFQRARFAYALKDYPTAERLARDLAARTSSLEMRSEASFLLGLAIVAQGREDDAAAVFQPLVGQAVRDKFPLDRLVWLADFQFSRGRHAEVAEIAAEILRRDDVPENVRQSANVLLGRSKSALGDTDTAAAAFKAAADSPARTRYSSEAALRYGELAMAQPSKFIPGTAEKYFRKAIELAPDDGQSSARALAYRRLAECREAENDVDGAIRLYLAVSLLYEDGDAVKSSMAAAARLLRQAGRTDEAEAVEEDSMRRFGRRTAE